MQNRKWMLSIIALVAASVLWSVLVYGQAQSSQAPASKTKATTKGKQPKRKATSRQQPAQSVQPAPQQSVAQPATPTDVVPASVTPVGAPNSASTKKPGVIRIGVVLPLTQIGQDADLSLSETMRQLLISYLNGPLAEAVPLEARVPVQAEMEARQKECDFVFYSAVGRQQQSSSIAKIIKHASPVVGMIPGGSAATTATGVATTTATTTDKVLKAATDLSGNIKARDEVSVAFKLTAQGIATPKLAQTLKAKAKTDGDQVLSTLLAEASNAVLQAALHK